MIWILWFDHIIKYGLLKLSEKINKCLLRKNGNAWKRYAAEIINRKDKDTKNMKCKQCKFDNNCEAKNKAQWCYGEGKAVTGCNLGEPKEEKHE